MFWTHKFDLLVKLLCAILVVLIMYLFLEWAEESINQFTGNPWPYLPIIAILGLFFSLYFLIFRTLGSFLYLRYTLKIPIAYDQAKQFNPALAPALPHKKWLPMHDIIHALPDRKYELALASIDAWAAYNGYKRAKEVNDFKDASLILKVVKVTGIIITCILILCSIMNWPPASYLSKSFMAFTGSNGYYPMLNMVLLCLPVAVLFTMIEKKMKG